MSINAAGNGAFIASQSNRCAVCEMSDLAIALSGTTHAKANVGIAKTAILIEQPVIPAASR